MITYTPNNRRADDTGFTLVEILVALAIFGLLAVIAVPAYMNQQDAITERSLKVIANSTGLAMTTYLGTEGYHSHAPTDLPSGIVPESVEAEYIPLNDGTYCLALTRSGVTVHLMGSWLGYSMNASASCMPSGEVVTDAPHVAAEWLEQDNRARRSTVQVTWIDIPGATYYEVERNGTILGGVSAAEGTKYIDADVPDPSTPAYRVRAKTSRGWSEWSQYAYARTNPREVERGPGVIELRDKVFPQAGIQAAHVAASVPRNTTYFRVLMITDWTGMPIEIDTWDLDDSAFDQRGLAVSPYKVIFEAEEYVSISVEACNDLGCKRGPWVHAPTPAPTY